MIITPTIGRIVWYWPRHSQPEVKGIMQQPLAGIVTFVHDDRLVNLGLFTADGIPFGMTLVTLVQENDPKPDDGNYAQWMPYQLGQAKKHSEVDKAE